MTFFFLDGIYSFLIKDWIGFEDCKLLDEKRRGGRRRTGIHDGFIERMLLKIETWYFLATDRTS